MNKQLKRDVCMSVFNHGYERISEYTDKDEKLKELYTNLNNAIKEFERYIEYQKFLNNY